MIKTIDIKDFGEPRVTENARRVLEARYLIKDDNGNIIETPKELYIRVASAVAGCEKEDLREDLTKKFYDMMARNDFMPNTPCLMNAGKNDGMVFACFVLPIEDSMDSIFSSMKDAAMIHKGGGGTGFSFSRLRPKNSMVKSTSGVSSGPVSFMTAYNAATEVVKQGSSRRGANMGILRVDHPDIKEFITCKADTSKITNFNISVAVTREFMLAVEEDRDYDLINPYNGERTSQNAREIMNMIVEQAHSTGEPGIIFIDRINEMSPSKGYETIESTNPCGEQPLPPYDSCVLGSINLGNMLLEHTYGESDKDWCDLVDWDRLKIVTNLAIRFLDNLIDINRYTLPKIEEQTKSNRRIGLGVMGFADLLIRLGISYDSEESIEVANNIMDFIYEESRITSENLAEEKGTFPNWDKSEWGKNKKLMRNLTLTTIAPTGSICIIAGCSSGIEPNFAIAYEKNVLDGQKLVEINDDFSNFFIKTVENPEEMIEKVSKSRSLAKINEIPSNIRNIFQTTDDISVEQHIKVQAVFQAYCDAAVSKTINLHRDAKREDVEKAYFLAYHSGCKGVTVYRDGSRPGQVLDLKTDKTQKGSTRPQVLQGFTDMIKTGYGTMYVTINEKDGNPFEVFATIGKSAHTTTADAEAISRLISLALRSGISIKKIIKQLQGIGGSAPMLSSEGVVGSIPDAISKVLARHYTKELIFSDSLEQNCQHCGTKLVHSNGCSSCPSCGNGKCG